MKKTLVLLSCLTSTAIAYSQFSSTNPTTTLSQVGIGTTTPNAGIPFNVVNDGTTYGGSGYIGSFERLGSIDQSGGVKFLISDFNDGRGDVIFDASQYADFALRTNGGSNVFILKNSGKVGIGTVAPTAKLHIPNGEMIIGGPDGLNMNALNFTLGVRAKNTLNSTYALYVGDNGGQDLFWSKGDGDAYIKKNLGIGVAGPTLALDVLGYGRFTEGLFIKRNGEGFISIANNAIEVGQLRGSGTTGLGFYSNVTGTHSLFAENSTGRIGIGTTTPADRLHIKTSTVSAQAIIESTESQAIRFSRTGVGNWTIGRKGSDNSFAINNTYSFDGTEELVLSPFGNLGVGTTAPTSRIHVKNGIVNLETGENDLNPCFMFGKNTTNNYGQIGLEYWPGKGLNFWTPFGSLNNLQNFMMLISETGNVGIGTDNFSTGSSTPTSNNNYYKLAVNGNLRAKEIVVETSWADYVFADNYKLKSLEEVDKYIQEHNTLPNVPSEQEIKKQNIGLGELTKIQQEKIEELTLYIIELNKEMKSLKEQVNNSK